jgi:4-amino-4-deoxy-L-arabinose transferase-like glycosyltransferase
VNARARLGPRLASLADRPWPLFVGIALLMLAVTVLAPSSLVDRSDEGVFLGYADRLTDGDYALEGGLDVELLWFGPGLPLLLAPFVALGVPVELLRVLGPLLLVLALVAFHRLLRDYVGPVPALLGTACLGLYLPLYRLLPRLYTEPLAILLLVTGILVGARGVRQGDRLALALSGLCFGGLALTRVEYGTVLAIALVISLAALLLPSWRATARRGAAIFAVALAVCVPWLAYTYDVSGEAFYWGNSGGLSLYWIAPGAPEDLGEPHPVFEVFENPDLAHHRPFFRSIEDLGPVDHDEALREEALDRIGDDPVEYGVKLAANFSRLWFRAPLSYEGVGAKTLFYAVPGALLLSALLLAAWRLLRRRARLPRELAPFLLVAAGGFGVHLLAAGYPRSIAPLVPVMVLVVVVATAGADPLKRAQSRPKNDIRGTPA